MTSDVFTLVSIDTEMTSPRLSAYCLPLDAAGQDRPGELAGTPTRESTALRAARHRIDGDLRLDGGLRQPDPPPQQSRAL